MKQKAFGVILCICLAIVLFPGVCRGQQTETPATGVTTNCPAQPPGVYIEGSSGWHQLSAANPSRIKAKHTFLSSLSDGAVAAPMVVEYADTHAAVQIHTTHPTVCVSHMMTPAPPLLVRLNVKKKIRELDSGSIRAIPFTVASRQGHAQASSIVPSTTQKPEDGIVLVEPMTDLAPGEYAVMFGAQNLDIFDFGVDAAGSN